MKKAEKIVYALYLHPFKGGKKEYDKKVKEMLYLLRYNRHTQESKLIPGTYYWTAGKSETDPMFAPVYIPEAIYFEVLRSIQKAPYYGSV